jgi:hypothetical protein
MESNLNPLVNKKHLQTDTSTININHKTTKTTKTNLKNKSHLNKNYMKITHLILFSSCLIIFSCKQKEVNVNKQKLLAQTQESIKQKKFSDENFIQTTVKQEQSFKGEYNVEKDKIISVDKSSEKITDVDYIINTSNNYIIITAQDGSIIEEFKVIKKEYDKDLMLYSYLVEKQNEKYLFSHVVEADGSYSYFEFRNKNSLRFYITKK